MGLETKGQMHADQGKGAAPAPAPTHKPSRLAHLVANLGRIDGRTLAYVLLIIVACALAIVAISAMAQMLISSTSAASSIARPR